MNAYESGAMFGNLMALIGACAWLATLCVVVTIRRSRGRGWGHVGSRVLRLTAALFPVALITALAVLALRAGQG